MGNLFAAFIIEFLFSKNSRSIFIKGIVLLLIGSILIKGFNLFIDYFPCFMVVILFFCVVYSLLRIIVIILNTHFVKQVKIDSFFSIKSVCKIFIGLFLIFLFSSYFLNAIEDSSSSPSNGPTIAALTSDTFSIASFIVSRLSFVKYTRLKSYSNFSSSIS